MSHNGKTSRNGLFKITPISPIHIGSGEKYPPFEYHINGKEAIIKDIQAFIDAHRDNPKYAEEIIETGAKGIEKDFPRYKLPYYGTPLPQPTQTRPQHQKPQQIAGGGPRGKIDPLIAKMMKQSQNVVQAPPPTPPMHQDAFKGTEIYAFVKDPFGKPFIPGTSLKGCLRTAIAYKREKEAKTINDAIKKARQEERPRKERAFAPANQILFGKGPTDDPLKALIIRDSQPLDIEKQFAINHVRVMNLMRDNKFTEKPGMRILTESLMPTAGTIEIPFVIDLFRLLNDPALPKETKNIIASEKLLEQTLREFSKDLLQHELEFYKKCTQNSAQTFIQSLINQNTIILDLGFGTGWNAKTIGMTFDPQTLKTVRNIWKLGKDAPIFPKTRKWVHNGKEYVPMGWFKLEIIWT